jgi:p-hydroxybenzoate 3-monooxygenase
MTPSDAAVGIIGAGPAGLLLSHLLASHGVSSVILEARSEAYVRARIRAGVLEQNTVDLLRAQGLGERLNRESMAHDGVELRINGQRHRIDLRRRTGGRSVTVYGQQEVVSDLIGASRSASRAPLFEAAVTSLESLEEDPVIHYRYRGRDERLRVKAVAGCDGFHGISRQAIPAEARRELAREYPYAWLGILAQVPPSSDEVIYAYHDRGLALHSMRSPELTRLYVQCDPADSLDTWPDERVWEELHVRLGHERGWQLREGSIIAKSITPMRTLVTEPMQHQRLYLAGDAAHIVPPSGAKGLNLAVRDVQLLASGLDRWLTAGDEGELTLYSDQARRHVWRAVLFTSWLTTNLHVRPGADELERGLQQAQLSYLFRSPDAERAFARQYAG